MRNNLENIAQKSSGISKEPRTVLTDDNPRHAGLPNSLKANIIFTFNGGKIVNANTAACKLMGYSKRELSSKSWSDIFDLYESGFKTIQDRLSSEGRYSTLVSARNKSSNLIFCEIISECLEDENNDRIISTIITDRSQVAIDQKNIDAESKKAIADNIVKVKSKQKKTHFQEVGKMEKDVAPSKFSRGSRITNSREDHKGKFFLAAKLSFDGIWDWNISTNEFYLGEGFKELLGYFLKEKDYLTFNWCDHLHPEDRQVVEKGLENALASSSTGWEQTYRLVRIDGSIVSVLGRARIIRGPEGKARRMIGVMHDTSKQKLLEQRLEEEIALKAKQIAEASEDAKDMERSELGKEMHDNVNQLLSTSRLYLDMAKRGEGNIATYISRSSEYILMAIEEIRKLTKGLATETIKNIGLCEAIIKATNDIMEASQIKISCLFNNFSENSVSDKFKLNIFRIVQEKLNNILKHSGATKAAIRLSQDSSSIVLTISDNGIGFDTVKTPKGIGIANIRSRAFSFHGTSDIVSRPGEGCVLTIVFPIPSTR